MILDCVITAVNEVEEYLDFIPIFVNTWNKLYPRVDVKIVLVAEKIPSKFLSYEQNIILFKPIENVLTSFTSQIIRLFYPCILNYTNGVLITDIDILPMNNTYFVENIQMYDKNRFIYYRDNVCFNSKQIAMCYNVASPSTWKDIFAIHTLEDINHRIKEINDTVTIKEGHGNCGWHTDQLILYDSVMKWDDRTKRFVRLKERHTKFKRLNRNCFDHKTLNILSDVRKGVYSDYHCLRPMSKYHEINYKIYDML